MRAHRPVLVGTARTAAMIGMVAVLILVLLPLVLAAQASSR
jgi:uncharacterized membrane protein